MYTKKRERAAAAYTPKCMQATNQLTNSLAVTKESKMIEETKISSTLYQNGFIHCINNDNSIALTISGAFARSHICIHGIINIIIVIASPTDYDFCFL